MAAWCHMKLLPSRHVLCTPYNHALCHFMKSHIRKVYACLAVTCHLHFWQNNRDLLRATAVTRGWNGYRNKSQHRKLALEIFLSRRFCRDSNPRPFDHESGDLTTGVSPHLSYRLTLRSLTYIKMDTNVYGPQLPCLCLSSVAVSLSLSLPAVDA